MDPFLSDRHARWHPVDLSLFPLRRYAPPPPASLHHHEIPSHPPPAYPNPADAGVRSWRAPPARSGLFWLLDSQK